MRSQTLGAIVFSTLFFLCCQAVYSQALGDFAASDKQMNFAKSLPAEIPGVVSAIWQSPMDIWIEADQATQSRAKDIARDVISEGKNVLDQSFCVHVHAGNFQQMLMTCWSSP